MQLPFSKWHGTGNDFIMVDDRESIFPTDDHDLIRKICHRHFGIGSDGIVLIQPARRPGTQFHMEFFNPDGSKSFCGNGSRCAYAFWCSITASREDAVFSAIDGLHEGRWSNGIVSISLLPVDPVINVDPMVDFLQNGSPHELVWVEDPDKVDLLEHGRERRYAPKHAPGGTNVNFLKVRDGQLNMRTYERGVENETLSCGTGVVAAALSALSRNTLKAPVRVVTRGGNLSVEAEADGNNGWKNIQLIGPAVEVYSGMITI